MDPVLAGLVVSVLTLILREIRWHRVHGKVEGERDQAREQSAELVKSLRPKAREMPPWDDVADSD